MRAREKQCYLSGRVKAGRGFSYNIGIKPFVIPRLATAAESTATNGLKRYNSVANGVFFFIPIPSISTGAKSAKVADVAPMPTQRGVTALTRSALARRPSASAEH